MIVVFVFAFVTVFVFVKKVKAVVVLLSLLLTTQNTLNNNKQTQSTQTCLRCESSSLPFCDNELARATNKQQSHNSTKTHNTQDILCGTVSVHLIFVSQYSNRCARGLCSFSFSFHCTCKQTKVMSEQQTQSQTIAKTENNGKTRADQFGEVVSSCDVRRQLHALHQKLVFADFAHI